MLKTPDTHPNRKTAEADGSTLSETLRNAVIIMKREFLAYFATPLASVFLTIFVAATGAFAFYIGGFFERGQANLYAFFAYHPWLYLLLVPAVAMRLWAEERKNGTIELLMTLPVTPFEAILGKFAAAWAFIGLALVLTFPMWITVNVLGNPDNGVILASYLGSFLIAGAFLALGSFISALTRNQVIAFIMSAAVCFLFVTSGTEMVQNTLQAWAPRIVADAVRSMSVLSSYEEITRGVVPLTSLIFFLSLIAFALFANVIAVSQKKSS